jgi:predicted nucleic acid-binding protein
VSRVAKCDLPWLFLHNRSGRHRRPIHESAVKILPTLEPRRIISDLIISESVTALGARLGSKAAQAVFENMAYDSATKMVYSGRRLYERAMLVYTRYDGNLSFPDSVTVRLMYDQKIKEIVSFDSDFDHAERIVRVS